LLAAVSDAIASSQQGSLALMLLDVADFPRLQARLGFEVSGVLLRSLSEHLSLALGDRGTVLRFGDASFCVLSAIADTRFLRRKNSRAPSNRPWPMSP
jgi:GGDEF domain-containing protein